MLLDGENQCGDELDIWFHFALNVVVSGIHMVFSKYQIFDILKELNRLLCEFFAHLVKYNSLEKRSVILFTSVTWWACVRKLDLRVCIIQDEKLNWVHSHDQNGNPKKGD